VAGGALSDKAMENVGLMGAGNYEMVVEQREESIYSHTMDNQQMPPPPIRKTTGCFEIT
jgi:hypothetical protein